LRLRLALRELFDRRHGCGGVSLWGADAKTR
jgi:hypothetical protein